MNHPWALLLVPALLFGWTAVLQGLQGIILQRSRWWTVPAFVACVIPIMVMAILSVLGAIAFALIPVGQS